MSQALAIILKGEGACGDVALRCRLPPGRLEKPVGTLVAAFCKHRTGLDESRLRVRLSDGRVPSLEVPISSLGLEPDAVVFVGDARSEAPPAKPPPPPPPRVLVLYAVCERGQEVIDVNVRFFLRHGVEAAAGYGDDFDVCVVANGGASPKLRSALSALRPPPRLVERDNAGGDFAAWGAGLAAAWDPGTYGACVFLNDTVRGPFVPRYTPPRLSWPALFASRLDDTVKLVGCSLNSMLGWEPRFRCPHVQSMAFACDGATVALLRGAAIFAPEADEAALVASCGALQQGLYVPGEQRAKTAYIFMHEIRMSKLVRDAGFDVFGFQVSETTGRFPMDDVQLNCDCMPLNPVETMFVKSSHGGFDVENAVLARYTRWLGGPTTAAATTKRKIAVGRNNKAA